MTIRRPSFEQSLLPPSHDAHSGRMHRVPYCSFALTTFFLIMNVTSYVVYNGTAQGNGYPAYNGTVQDSDYLVHNGTAQDNAYPVHNGTAQDNGYSVHNGTVQDNGYPVHNGTVQDNVYPVNNGIVQDNGYLSHSEVVNFSSYASESMGNITSYPSTINVVHNPDTYSQKDDVVNPTTLQSYIHDSPCNNYHSHTGDMVDTNDGVSSYHTGDMMDTNDGVSSYHTGDMMDTNDGVSSYHIGDMVDTNDDASSYHTGDMDTNDDVSSYHTGDMVDTNDDVSSYTSHTGNIVDTNDDVSSYHTGDLLSTSYVTNDSDITDFDPLSVDTVCPEMCSCKHYVANCSSNYGKLTFIPRLPLNITHLIFSRNDLTTITSDSFFSNITNITYLDLSYNGLTSVSSGAFNIFTGLKTLKLNRNRLNKSSLILVLSIKTLSILNLNVNNIRYVSSYMFCRQSRSNLKTVTLYDNNIKTLAFAAFSECKNLTYLNVGDNLIIEIKPKLMSSLQYLTLHHNYIGSFPKTCRNNTSSFFPNLIHLNLTANDIDAVHNVCLPNLQVLDLSFNTFTRIESYTFSSSRFPSLQILTLQSTIGTGRGLIIERNAFSNSVLKRITLSHCRASFRSDENVHPEAFADCPALQEINLEDNYFPGVSDSKYYKLFGNLTSLRILNLGYNHIHGVTGRTYHSLKYLRNFYLYGNLLETIPDGTFDSMTDLKVLHLGGNKLTSIKETTFSESLRQRLHQIDLSKNPFVCSCDIMWFRNWILSNESQFYGTSGGYRCWNIRNRNLTEFYLPDQACLLSGYTFTFTVVSVILLLITMIITAVFYRLRWHIRLLLYETFRGRSDERRLHNLRTGNFLYDVFVSYSAEDINWVREHLMPELEVHMGLRLCIHQRDFIPGQNILDNIVDNLEKSKKVMLIFSTHFARSHWCQVELALCLQHVMDHDDILVVVCLENLPHRSLTSAMLAVLTITTYIQWEDAYDARRSFWERINNAFHEIRVQGRCNPTFNLNILE